MIPAQAGIHHPVVGHLIPIITPRHSGIRRNDGMEKWNGKKSGLYQPQHRLGIASRGRSQ